VAGHETSATSLTWALFYIHHDPFLKNRLREELQVYSEEFSIDKVIHNDFLDRVVNEALRIHPPVPFVTRKIVNRDFEMGGKVFKVGEEIGICLSLLHQQENIWKDYSVFNPERFKERKYTPYEFAPFGGGTRKCIGAELSILELKIIIAYFLKSFEGQLKKRERPLEEVMQITVGPKKMIGLNYKKIRGE
jgi:cytochrome P450